MSEAMCIEVIDTEKAAYEEYAELLIKRDQLLKEADSCQISYTAEFGDLIAENYELKIRCIKKKKTISYCRRRMNRGLPVDTDRMNAEIEWEMLLYYAQLKEMLEDTKAAKTAEKIGQYRYNRSKKLYRKLAKLLHPDINRRTLQVDSLKELWTRIVNAYQLSDVDELEDLEVLVRRAFDELGEDGFELDVSDIEERIESLESRISEILTTEPYTYRELLRDDEKKEALRELLQEEHEEYEVYLADLTRTLDELLRGEGMRIIWKMH